MADATLHSNADEGVDQTSRYTPYRFKEQDYADIKRLTVAWGMDWTNAIKDYQEGKIRNWFLKELKDNIKVNIIDEINNDKNISSIDEKFFEFLCRIDPKYEFIFRGTLITPKYLAALALKIIKNEAAAGEKLTLSLLIGKKIIYKYYNLTGNMEEFNSQYDKICSECSNYRTVEDYAKIMLINFSDKFKRIMLKKIEENLNNGVIVKSFKGYKTVNDILKKIEEIRGGNFTTDDLIKFSEIDGEYYRKNIELKELYENVKKTCNDVFENNNLKTALETSEDFDWGLLKEISLCDRPERTHIFYNKLINLKAMIDDISEEIKKKENPVLNGNGVSAQINLSKPSEEGGHSFDISIVSGPDYVVNFKNKSVYGPHDNLILASQRSMFSMSRDSDYADPAGTYLFSIKKVSSSGIILVDTFYELLSYRNSKTIGGYVVNSTSMKILDKAGTKLAEIDDINMDEEEDLIARWTIGKKLEIDINNRRVCTFDIGMINTNIYFSGDASPEIRLLILLAFTF